MPNITKISAKREEMLTSSMDTHERATDEKSMKRHKEGVKKFINELDEFDEKNLKEYFNDYCADDDNFAEIEVADKPKRTLSEEQKAKMKEGREKAKAAREAAAKDGDEKPKSKAKAKSAKA